MLIGNGGLIAESANEGQSFVLHRAPGGKGFSALVQNGEGGIIFAGEGGITALDPAWLKSR
jgi:hypothetical protein